MSDSEKPPTRWALLLARQLVRLIVAALVVWGVGRTVRDAVEELDRQQRELQTRVEGVAAARAALSDSEADRARREELDRQLQVLRGQNFSPWQIRPAWLLLAGVFYSLGLVPNWLFWRRTLQALGARPTLLESARAHFVGHLGKYVPGKAMVVVMRTSLVRSERTGATVAAVAVFIETLTMMAVGAMVASLVLVFFWSHWLMLLIALGLAVAAGVPTLPPVFRQVVRVLKLRKADANIEESLRGLDFRLMIRGWLMVGVGWLLLGMSLWATIRAMPTVHQSLGESLAHIPLLTACVGLAMVLGFVSLLPGGIGVREWVVMTLVAPEVGAFAALASAVLLRIVWLLSELLISAILYFGHSPAKAGARAVAGAAGERLRTHPETTRTGSTRSDGVR